MALSKALRNAKRPERVVDICFDESLTDEYRGLRAAQINDHSMAGGDVETPEMAALKEQIREATEYFTLRSVSRSQLMNLIAEHPPREGDVADEAVGFNRDTYHEALVRASVVEPELSPADWDELDGILTPGQWTRLMAAANELSMASGHVPFSSSA